MGGGSLDEPGWREKTSTLVLSGLAIPDKQDAVSLQVPKCANTQSFIEASTSLCLKLHGHTCKSHPKEDCKSYQKWYITNTYETTSILLQTLTWQRASQSLDKEFELRRAQNNWRRNQVGSIGLANRNAFGEKPARWFVGNSHSTGQSNCKSRFCDVWRQHCFASWVYQKTTRNTQGRFAVGS